MKKTFLLVLFFFCACTIQQVVAADSLDLVIVFANNTDATKWKGLLKPREVEISYPSEARLWRFPITPLKFTVNGKEYTIPMNNPAKAIGVIGERSDAIGVGDNSTWVMPPLPDSVIHGTLLNSSTRLFPHLTPDSVNSLFYLPKNQIVAQQDVKIYLLDTGVELEQNGLPSNALLRSYIDMNAAWNFVNNTHLPHDDHTDAHGTAVAGIVTRYLTYLTNPQNKNIKIVPLKVLNEQGSGTAFNVIKAIDKATREHATLINCSLAIKKSIFSFARKPPLQIAIEKAEAEHILVIAGAGNDDVNIECRNYYPAVLPNNNIIAVGASKYDKNESKYEKTDFSNKGRKSVDVFAPGQKIGSIGKNNNYLKASGTSFSAPIVTGLAALLTAQGTIGDFLEVKKRIMETKMPVSGLSRACVTGGIINVQTALRQ
jgi:subtilisin family serine protease